MKSTKNSIFIIHPYLHGSSWVFDDKSVGLVKEPFVAGADTLLDILSEGEDSCEVLFSEIKFPTAEYTLEYKSGKIDQGTDYFCKELNHALWLCPALGCYFDDSPKTIYLQIKTKQ